MVCKSEQNTNSPTLTLLRCINTGLTPARISNVEQSYANVICDNDMGGNRTQPPQNPHNASLGELGNYAGSLDFIGRSCRDRTDDPLIKSQLLYRLS